MRPATLLTGTPSHERTPVDPTPWLGEKGGHLLGDETCRPSRPLRGQGDGARSEFEGLAGTVPKSALPCDRVLLEGGASAVGAEVE